MVHEKADPCKRQLKSPCHFDREVGDFCSIGFECISLLDRWKCDDIAGISNRGGALSGMFGGHNQHDIMYQ